jgi:hypothetical protein
MNPTKRAVPANATASRWKEYQLDPSRLRHSIMEAKAYTKKFLPEAKDVVPELLAG